MGREGRISIMEAVSWIAYGDFDESKKEGIPSDWMAYGDSLPTKEAIKESNDTFSKIISEAEKQLLLEIRGGKLCVYGVPYGSNGDSLIMIPLAQLEAVGVKLISSSNKILRYTKDDRPIQSSMWVEVEVRKDDVMRFWQAHTGKVPRPRGKPKGVRKIDDSSALQEIKALVDEGRPVKTSCEILAASKGFTDDKMRNATVDRWRRKFREDSVDNK